MEGTRAARTVVFSFDFPPNDGGISRLCAAIAAGLAERTPLEVLTQKCDPARGVQLRVAEIHTTRVTRMRPVRELAAWWRLRRYDSEAVIIAGIWYPEGVIALLAGRRDLVVLAHGAELLPPTPGWKRAVLERLRRWTLRRARVVIANSRYTRALAHDLAPCADVTAIPLAVDADFFSPGDCSTARRKFGLADTGGVVISTVTRILEYKGVDTVLRAIAALPHHLRGEVTYLLAGKGPDIESLLRLAGQLGIERNLRWLGFVPDTDLPDVYRASDLFVLCTRQQPSQRSVEGFGLVFLEAQACGTPVVGTRTGGIPDAIREGRGGWLIEQDDVAALRDILADLVDNRGTYQEAGRLARMRVERDASWERYIAQFQAVLEGGAHER